MELLNDRTREIIDADSGDSPLDEGYSGPGDTAPDE